MLAEWNAECSAESPTIVVPWTDAASGLHFVDLRNEPYDIAEIREAETNAAMGHSLRALNASRSPLLTSKCDVWHLAGDDDELATLRFELDLDDDSAAAGTSSYIDILWRDRALFSSSHQQREMLDRLIRRAHRLDHPEATLVCVLRPAVADFAGTIEGFAFTLYVRAVGIDPTVASTRWSAALEDIVALLRGKDLAPARPSATIDASPAQRGG